MKKLSITDLKVSSFKTSDVANVMGGAEAGPTEHKEACPFTQALRDPLCAPTGLCITV